MFRYILNDITDQGNDFISFVKWLQRRKMKHELKIVMNWDDEGMDCDQSTPLHKVIVSIDDQPVGCIQNITLSADANKWIPELSVSFPDMEKLDIDKSVYPSGKPNLWKEIDSNIEKLKSIPGVDVKLVSIDDGMSFVIMLNEVGTDGHIDSYPMKRRHK